MLDNIRLHTEWISPISIIFLIFGGILGYGGNLLLRLVFTNPSDKVILTVKFIGLLMVLAGAILIFWR